MYCGLRKANRKLERYRMTREEIEQSALLAVQLGYGTVVIQAGEDGALKAEGIAEIVSWIKRNTPLAVTLSLGERSLDELRLWRNAAPTVICCVSKPLTPISFAPSIPALTRRAYRVTILRQIKQLAMKLEAV